MTDARLTPRLSRTLARGRDAEYRELLASARDAGYRIVALEDWALNGAAGDVLVLILRHDVDQHPRSALAMAAIEAEFGVCSTWYFRWRTADRGVVRAIRDTGASVGLHYETLSRLALERAIDSEDGISALIPEARALLRREVVAFERLHGPIRGICAHGDSRIPLALNSRLMQSQDARDFGVEFDANEAMRGRGLAYWLTDRPTADRGWSGGSRPADLLAAGTSPMLCLVHPNNWVSGPSLWLDRLLAWALPPARADGRTRGPLRTGADAPAL